MSFWKRVQGLFGERAEKMSAAASPQEIFAQAFAAEAADFPGVARVERDPDATLTLHVWRVGAENPTIMYLSNLYQETRELSPEDKRAKVLRFLGTLEDQDEDWSWESVASSVVPLLRIATFCAGSPFELLKFPFVPHVSLVVGVDRGSSIALASRDKLEEWGLEAEVVREAAYSTLFKHIADSDVEAYDPDAGYPIWYIARDDDYQSSRLALPGFLASFRDRVEGNPIAIIPERSTLIVSGDGRPEAIARLARTAEAEFNASPRSISPAVYTVGMGGAIEPLCLPVDHEHGRLIERGHRLLAATSYAEQKHALEQQFEREETDIFVASAGLISNKDNGETRTWSAMPEGVDTLLPETDLVAFGGGQEDTVVLVPWATVLELAGDCLEKDPAFDPPRWRVRRWPDDAIVQKLRAAAIG